jgi:hydroxymethylglutaryl-CoA reductase
MKTKLIQGFSKLSRNEKLAWIGENHGVSKQTLELLEQHLHPDPHLQDIYGEISENTISNFFLPLGLAPNFLINGSMFTVPMVIEESSVVAAASHAAKFWARHGGFGCEVIGTVKTGQVHFSWDGEPDALYLAFQKGKENLLGSLKPFTRNMEKRGGGIRDMEIRSAGSELPGMYQLFVTFLTADAMGANFINTILEAISERLSLILKDSGASGSVEVLMSILSNYTPECRVACRVEGDISIFSTLYPGMTGEAFAQRFRKAVDIAVNDPYRAVTHNKGILNGMDAVLMATGNDYRAVESCAHAYASRDGQYRSLSSVELDGNSFRFSLEVPIAAGTVGGLTTTHPLAAASLEILGNPSSETLMQIIASAGLANNFSAVRSLITSGIQSGHMKMHLGNILRQLNATKEEITLVQEHFRSRTVSHSEVSVFLDSMRNRDKE